MARTTKCRETTQESRHTAHSQILEAIAKGVETRLLRTVIVNIVTIESMCIARKLHIPEKEIQEWRSSRFFRSESIGEKSNLWSEGEGNQDSPDLTALTNKDRVISRVSTLSEQEHILKLRKQIQEEIQDRIRHA